MINFKYIKDNLFNIVALIPVLLVVVGSFVVSINLNRYGVIDFPLFDARTVYVGLVALVQMILFAVVWRMFLVIDGGFKGLVYLLINMIWKSFVFVQLAYAFIIKDNELTSIEFNGVVFETSKVVAFSYLTCIAFFACFINGREYIIKRRSGDLLGGDMFRAGLFLTVLGVLSQIILICNLSLYRDVFWSYFGISFVLTYSYVGKWSVLNDKKRGVGVHNASLFEDSEIFTWLDAFYLCSIFLFMISFFIYKYSVNIYPLVPTNIGGGYYSYSSIELVNGSFMYGKIIHSNHDYLYIKIDENSLTQVKLDDISRYISSNNTDKGVVK